MGKLRLFLTGLFFIVMAVFAAEKTPSKLADSVEDTNPRGLKLDFIRHMEDASDLQATHYLEVEKKGIVCCGIVNGFMQGYPDKRLATIVHSFCSQKIRALLSKQDDFEELHQEIEKLMRLFCRNILKPDRLDDEQKVLAEDFFSVKTRADNKTFSEEIQRQNKEAWEKGGATLLLVLLNQANGKGYYYQIGDNIFAIYSNEGELLARTSFYNISHTRTTAALAIDQRCWFQYWFSNNGVVLPWPLYYLGDRVPVEGSVRGRARTVNSFTLRPQDTFILATASAVGTLSDVKSDLLERLVAVRTRQKDMFQKFGKCITGPSGSAAGKIFEKINDKNWSLFCSPKIVAVAKRSIHSQKSLRVEEYPLQAVCTVAFAPNENSANVVAASVPPVSVAQQRERVAVPSDDDHSSTAVPSIPEAIASQQAVPSTQNIRPTSSNQKGVIRKHPVRASFVQLPWSSRTYMERHVDKCTVSDQRFINVVCDLVLAKHAAGACKFNPEIMSVLNNQQLDSETKKAALQAVLKEKNCSNVSTLFTELMD